MPGMSGIDLVKKVREHNIVTYFIIMSAYSEFEYAREAMFYGIKYFIVKPIQISELNTMLQNVVKEISAFDNNPISLDKLQEVNRINSKFARLCSQKILQVDKLETRQYLKEWIELTNSRYNDISKTNESAIELIIKIVEELESDSYKITFDSSVYSKIEDINSLCKDEQSLCNLLSEIVLFMENSVSMINETTLSKRIMDYIKNHYSEEITLEVLAKNFYMNPVYLGSYFKKNTGKNYNTYLTECRMNAAKDLLTNTELSIDIICNRVGYQSVRYFNKLFKEVFLVSPNQFRKNLR